MMKNSKAMKIRKFKSKDAEVVSKIMIEAFRSFLKNKINSKDKRNRWSLKSFSPERFKKNSNRKEGDSEIVSYVVEKNGQIVGYISGSASIYGTGTLAVVGVRPNCFHKGIGTILMKELEKFWQKKKIWKVSTCVSAHNTRALIYYLKNGFIPVGYRNDYFIAGVDKILLERKQA